MRRRTSSIGALGLLLVLVAAFVPSAGLAGSAGSSQTTTVSLAGWASSPVEAAALNRTIAQFERLNRDIKVEFTPISGDYDAAMLARFAAKRPPDVFYVESLDFFDYLPALEPLNGYIQRTRNWPTRIFYTRLLNGFSANGRIYGFPKDWSPLGLIANAQMFQRANVTVPRGAPATWAQFTQMLQRLRASNAVPGGAPACLSLDWARILPLMYQNGGGWVNPARTRSVISSPQNRATLNTYLGWLRSGLGQTPAQLGVGWCGEAIGKEKAAVVFEGNWIYGYLQTDFPSVRFSVNPMIRGKARGNLGFNVAYSIGKDSSNKKAAWRLLRFLAGKQGQAVWVKNSGYLPGRSDVSAPPGRANFLREAPYARPWQFVKGFQRVLDFAGKELEATYNGDQSVAQMLADINRETQDAIDRSR